MGLESYKSRGTNIYYEDDYIKPNQKGTNMRKKDNTPRTLQSFSPNRFEYFAAIALQGLVIGRSEKDVKKSVKTALVLAEELEDAIDSQENN